MATTEGDLSSMTLEQFEALLGERLKNYRINKLCEDQASLSSRAGICTRTLRNLEMGRGSSLRTYIAVVTAMERHPWLLDAIPEIHIPPVVVKFAKQKKRIYKPRSKASSE